MKTPPPEESIPIKCFNEALIQNKRDEAELEFCIEYLKSTKKESGDEHLNTDIETLLDNLGSDIHYPSRSAAANAVLVMGSLLTHSGDQVKEKASSLLTALTDALGEKAHTFIVFVAMKKTYGNQTEAAKLTGLSQGRISQIFNDKIAPVFEKQGIRKKAIFTPDSVQATGKQPGWTTPDDMDNLSDTSATMPHDYEQERS